MEFGNNIEMSENFGENFEDSWKIKNNSRKFC